MYLNKLGFIIDINLFYLEKILKFYVIFVKKNI